MHRHCVTNNKAPWWAFTDPCKPEARPGAREESASPAWLAAPAMNARDTTKVYIWRLDTGCGPTLYRKCHSHNTPGKRHKKDIILFIVLIIFDKSKCVCETLCPRRQQSQKAMFSFKVTDLGVI